MKSPSKQPLRSRYTVVVVLVALLFLGLILLGGRTQECKTFESVNGEPPQETCLDKVPVFEIGDLFD